MKDSEIEERLEKMAQQIGGMHGMLMHMDEVLEKVHPASGNGKQKTLPGGSNT